MTPGTSTMVFCEDGHQRGAVGHHSHLSIEEREDVMLLARQHKSVREIARATGRDKSTVSRELRRNAFRVGEGSCYQASTTQLKYMGRRSRCRRRMLLDDPGLRALVVSRIRDERWSRSRSRAESAPSARSLP